MRNIVYLWGVYKEQRFAVEPHPFQLHILAVWHSHGFENTKGSKSSTPMDSREESQFGTVGFVPSERSCNKFSWLPTLGHAG